MSVTPADTLYYEVNTTNIGPGANTAGRVPWVHQTNVGLSFDSFFTGDTNWLKSVSRYGASVSRGMGYFSRCCTVNDTSTTTTPPGTPVLGYPANVLSDAIVVAQDGTGNFTTIQDAVDSISAPNTKERVIYIKAGNYSGSQITITTNYITLVGDGIGKTVISNKYNNPMWQADHPGQSGASAYCATVRVTASYFKVFDLTMENTATSDQAPAFYIYGSNMYAENVAFISFQDTLLSWVGNNQWFYNCYIQGDVDFIWGYGRAAFQNCEFHVVNRPKRLAGTDTTWWGSVVANGATPAGSQSTSCFWLYNSSISVDARTTAYLGRNWGTLPCAYFQNVFMPSAVPAVGYSAMTSGNITTNYYEVGGTNVGPGNSTAGRVSWSKVTDTGFSSIASFFNADVAWLSNVLKYGSSVNQSDGYFSRVLYDTPAPTTTTTAVSRTISTSPITTTTTIAAPSWFPKGVPYNAIVVSQNGTGQFTSIQAAIDSVPSANYGEVVIYITAGTYKVSSSILVSKNYITLVGDGMNATIITASLNGLANGTIYVTGSQFKAFDLTLENTGSGQAPAFIVQADNVYLENCAIQGWQSPIFAWTGTNQMFFNCFIRGDVDIIIGNARTLIQNSEVRVGNKKVTSGSTGYIATNGNQASTGTSAFWIFNSSISSDPLTTAYLGRAWYSYSAVTYQSVYMPQSVPAAGWGVVSAGTQSALLVEVNTTNTGPGALTQGRVPWATQTSVGLTFSGFFSGDTSWLTTISKYGASLDQGSNYFRQCCISADVPTATSTATATATSSVNVTTTIDAQTATIPVSTTTTTSPAAVSTPSNVPNSALVVSSTGAGQFTSIQAALDSVPTTNSAEVVIYITAGTYSVTSSIKIASNYITLVGDGINKTIITSALPGLGTGTVAVSGSFFKAFDITFENTLSSGQANALSVQGSNMYFENIAVQGWQSPMYAWSGTNQVFYNCIFRGDVDIIIGSSRAMFQNSEIHVGNKMLQLSGTASGITGYIATNGNRGPTSSSSTSWFWIYNTTISTDPLSTSYLGRAWTNYSAVTYQSVYMPSSVPAAGWSPIYQYTTQTQLYEVTGTNTGPGADVSERASWSNQASTGYTFDTFFTGDTTWMKAISKYGSSVNQGAGYFQRGNLDAPVPVVTSTTLSTSSSTQTIDSTVASSDSSHAL
ncbi:carbohydrate esterase family 8 protein [Gonapodya prolifera JEL478]|uniref:pectinesterase n=1 Tax=Gonapodya prolifera (strain JEL478) TaxID=1344416 RepID=A0A139A3H1_GONPJ|nr:carbohydrate esterase family 8 protein [Gonapodya prolifera JEL478]|eukprot:KXS11264.1 carbohydrate esterase family 8 protein [Gonapodya prolifera JEL478]